MTKDEKEKRQEIAEFSRRKALQWAATKKQLQATLDQMEDHNLYGYVFHQLDQLISAADAEATSYWKEYYQNK